MADTPLRHAYMIVAHNNFAILEKQLRFLDSENADFFLHIDAKVKGLDTEKLSAIPRRSRVFFVERFSVAWGDFTMIEAELALLKAAVPGKYDYYHLLSGVDVPVKSRADIERFFAEHKGVNFIDFLAPKITRHDRWRVELYYPFQRLNIRTVALRRLLRNLCIAPQLLSRVDRTKKYPAELTFQKGAAWYDITHDFAAYVLSREADIRKIFRCTYCTDEVFIQTLAVSSPFSESLWPEAFSNGKGYCRYVDWDRGNPYTFTEADFEELTHTAPIYLFARKFDYTAHPSIVDRLFAFFGDEK